MILARRFSSMAKALPAAAVAAPTKKPLTSAITAIRSTPTISTTPTTTTTSTTPTTTTTTTNTAKTSKKNNTPTTIRLHVNELEQDTLLQRYLHFHQQMPISLIEKLVRKREIWVIRADGSKVKRLSSKTNLQPGDVVHIRHAFHQAAAHDQSLDQLLYFPPVHAEESRALQAAIIYMDRDLLVINKPADLTVQGGTSKANNLQRFFHALKFDYAEPPRLVHRLDKKTTGVLILARHQRAAARLSEMFRRSSDPDHMLEASVSVDAFGEPAPANTSSASTSATARTNNTTDTTTTSSTTAASQSPGDPRGWSVEKTYWAILTGVPSNARGRIDRHLYVPPESKIALADDETVLDAPYDIPSQYKVSVQHPSRISPYHHRRCLKRAVTGYEVLAEIGRRGAWVRLCPETGRKHQLRVHAADVLRCGILGDMKYGVRSFRELHQMGWGSVFDFSKWTGVKSSHGEEGGGMPMYLHLRQLVIRNYFGDASMNSGRGEAASTSSSSTSSSSSIPSSIPPPPATATFEEMRRGKDLVLTAKLPEEWKLLMKAVLLDPSAKA